MYKILILMIFCHIIDDFVLQTKLAKFKQKKWWEDTCAKYKIKIDKYEDDYKIALFTHALEWSIAISLPIIFLVKDVNEIELSVVILSNAIIHSIIDHFKANKMKLSLFQDQILHYLQIIVTWFIFMI